MYTGPGERVDKIASKDLVHGQAVVEGKHVGFASKTDQPVWNVDPTDAAITAIPTGTSYVLFVVGVHEIALTGGLSGAAVGDLLWVHPADNTVHLAGTAAAGDYPLGIIDEIDASRTPPVARVNLNDRAAFNLHA